MLTSLGIGGAERQALAIAARMAGRGHTVAVLSLRPRVEEEWPTELPVFRLNLHKNPASLCVAILRARRVLRAFRPDIIHSHSFHANILARLLKLFVPSAAIVSTIHNIDEGGPLRMLAYRLTGRLCTHATTVSEAVAQRFIAHHAVCQSQCSVICNAIDPAEFVPNSIRRAQTRAAQKAGADFIWLAAGRLAPAKDYPNLLQAFALLRARHANVQLWIAGLGTGAGTAALLSQAGQLGIEDCMRYLGLRRDLAAFLDGADAFVLSSAWEGMPLALAEAMAMEKPVVATDVGGARELTGDCGVLVSSRNPGALADAMDAAMRLPEDTRQAQGRAARGRVQAQFSFDARIEKWEELYRQVLRLRRG